jgi:hyaluronoglucosaminidase
VCVPAITAADARAFGEAIQRKPLIWDNYPVNDLAMAPELHIGALRGRDPALAEVVTGMVANPMNQPEATKVPLQTYAEYLADPAGYDPDAAWERALRAAAGREADYRALRLLAELSLRSCLHEPEAVTLKRLAAEALAAMERGEAIATSPAAQALERYLVSLDEAVYHLRYRLPNLALRNDLLPWLEKLEHLAWMGRHTLAVLQAAEHGAPLERARRQWMEATEAYTKHPMHLSGEALAQWMQIVNRRVEMAAVQQC